MLVTANMVRGEDLQLWPTEQGVTPTFIETASPTENCTSSGSRSMGRELVNGELFHSVLEAKVVTEEWLVLYNTRRPNRGLASTTLAACAKMFQSHLDDDTCGGGQRERLPPPKVDQSRPGHDFRARARQGTEPSHEMDQVQGTGQ